MDLGLAAKVRPCLVLSIPPLIQDRALGTVIPHTTAHRGSRFEVNVKAGFLRPGVFDAQNVVTIHTGKLLIKLGTLSPQQLSSVESAVRSRLDL